MWRQTQHGDHRSFRLLYERAIVPLTNRVYRILGDADLTKDILQEVFISLYQKRAELPADLNVMGYLQNAVKYKISNTLRDRLSRAGHEEELSKRYMSVQTDHGHVYEKKELGRRIGARLASLPEKCRQAFMLSHFGDLSYKAVANEMGISVKTVEKHVSKALRVLRKELDNTNYN